MTTQELPPKVRPLPHSAEAEAHIIGAILNFPDDLYRVDGFLRSEHFYSKPLGDAYRAALDVAGRKGTPDRAGLGDELEARGRLEALGGREGIERLWGNVTSAQMMKHYSAVIVEAAYLRNVVELGIDMAERALDATPTTIGSSQFIAELRDRVTTVLQGESPQDVETWRLLVSRVHERLLTGKGSEGLRTGFFNLDATLGGFGQTDLIILGARPGAGKTALACSLVHNVLMRDEPGRVLFFSLEMSREQIAERLLSISSGVPMNKSHTGFRVKDDAEKLVKAKDALELAPMTVIDGVQTIPGLRSAALREHSRTPIALVVIDYLQLLVSPDEKDRRIEVEDAGRMAKSLAQELRCPVLALSQLRRPGQGREDQRPGITELRESGSLEQDADVCLLLYRHDYIRRTEESADDIAKRGTAELDIAKHRNGPVGMVMLNFQHETMHFRNLAPQMEVM